METTWSGLGKETAWLDFRKKTTWLGLGKETGYI